MTIFYTLLECLKSSSRYWQISGKYWRLLNQAAAEFVGGNQAGTGRAPSSPNVLLAVVDQWIPTSDLEDRSRPDPMISTTTVAAGEPNIFEIKEIMSNFESADAEGQMESRFRNFSIPETFDMPQLTSDNWLTTSLFASSGYQHYIN
ncbi:hypothetical protein H072_10348 [Dactylellina haptotyla CBS 200.50]|uniref:Uncharacterized protein n=1 Tax=Dactylellina haptotyla (strain CBS 200.50) TaxID=1284197 RepID=S7ZZN7_DACHA|nr:hypothetical protein H072_10348 [Dactylellina haptotyla CBS 200.50]